MKKEKKIDYAKQLREYDPKKLREAEKMKEVIMSLDNVEPYLGDCYEKHAVLRELTSILWDEYYEHYFDLEWIKERVRNCYE